MFIGNEAPNKLGKFHLDDKVLPSSSSANVIFLVFKAAERDISNPTKPKSDSPTKPFNGAASQFVSALHVSISDIFSYNCNVFRERDFAQIPFYYIPQTKSGNITVEELLLNNMKLFQSDQGYERKRLYLRLCFG